MNEIDNIVKFNNNYSKWIACGIYCNIDEICNVIQERFDSNKRGDEAVLELDKLLIIACWKGNEIVVKKLVSLGANIETRSLFDTTPIMFVAQRDSLEMFIYLISIGANMYAVSKNGLNVESYAKEVPKSRVYEYIIDIKNKNSVSSIELLKKNNTMIIKNKELEDKINFLMQQLKGIQLNQQENERPRKKQKQITEIKMDIVS